MWLWLTDRRPRAIACAALALGICCLVRAQTGQPAELPQPAAAWHEWLSSRLPEGQGTYDFAVALFTGNMSRDPLHADAQRRLVSAWLNLTIVPGDTLTVAGAEHTVWTASPAIPMDGDPESRRKAFSLLPAGPDPHSRGGKSIETALAELAARIPQRDGRGTALIMLSNSWSQNGRTVEDAVGRLQKTGFRLHREMFAVPTARGSRQVLVTACIRPPTGSGTLAPRRYDLPRDWVPSADAPVTGQEPRPSGSARGSGPAGARQGRAAPPTWLMALAGLALGGAGLAAGRWTRRPAPAPAAPPLPPAPPPAERLAEFETVMDNARKHTADLQTVRDSLLELVSNRIEPAPPQPLGRAEAGDLRTEVASLQHDLAEWDRTAIAFLEAAEAAVRSDAADERLRRTWQRAADSFCRMAQRHGFSRIAPEPGEPFVPGLHRAVAVDGDPAQAGIVAECLAWGYQNGSTVYKLADVRVTDQPPSSG